MKMKKTLHTALAASLAVTMLAGCSQPAANSGEGGSSTATAESTASGEPTTISVMCQASWAGSEGELAQLAYVEEAMNVKFEFERVPDGNEGEQVIQTRFASGEVPDILLWQPASYVKGRMSLEENFVDVSGEWQQYYDADAIATPSYTQDGVLYGAPWGDATLYGMCYNKDVFEEYDLTVPTTWDELYAICDKLKDTGITPVYYSGADAWTLQIMALDGFGQAAAGQDFNEFINKMDTNQMHWVDLSVAQAMLDREKDLVDKGYVQETYLSDTYQDAQTGLLDGTIAMYPHASWIAPILMEADPEGSQHIGFFPLPTEDGSKVVTMANPNAMYVSAKGSQVELAKQVVSCLASKEALSAKYSALEGIPFIQGLDNVELTGINKDGMDLMNEEGVCIASPVDFTKYTKGPLETYIQEMLVGDKTSEEVLAALDNDFATQAIDAGDANWS